MAITALAGLVIFGLLFLFARPSLEDVVRKVVKRNRKHRYYRD